MAEQRSAERFITGIQGLAELLGPRDYDEAERRRHVAMIHAQSLRLTALVDTLLELRAPGAALLVEPDRFLLAQVIANLISTPSSTRPAKDRS